MDDEIQPGDRVRLLRDIEHGELGQFSAGDIVVVAKNLGDGDFVLILVGDTVSHWNTMEVWQLGDKPIVEKVSDD